MTTAALGGFEGVAAASRGGRCRRGVAAAAGTGVRRGVSAKFASEKDEDLLAGKGMTGAYSAVVSATSCASCRTPTARPRIPVAVWRLRSLARSTSRGCSRRARRLTRAHRGRHIGPNSRTQSHQHAHRRPRTHPALVAPHLRRVGWERNRLGTTWEQPQREASERVCGQGGLRSLPMPRKRAGIGLVRRSVLREQPVDVGGSRQLLLL